jgi:dolichol-phosphate mannosyltransferase
MARATVLMSPRNLKDPPPMNTLPAMGASVVIPCRNEAANLTELIDEVHAAMAGRDYELIIVDDGSTDGTADAVMARISAGDTRLRLMRHDRSAGQSAALRSGVFAARGAIILTLDGDGQNDPAYLPGLQDALLGAGDATGIAAGQRLKRTDTKLKQMSSRFANGLRQSILKDDTRDSGCGLKAVRADLFRALPYFDGWHRYLPALCLREGFGVVHLDVVDRQRRHGKSNYGILDRGARGVLDLFGVWWLRRRRKTVPQVTEMKP